MNAPQKMENVCIRINFLAYLHYNKYYIAIFMGAYYRGRNLAI